MNSEAAFAAIPHMPLGDVPESFPEEHPKLYRSVVAKRAILAGYESGSIDSITDLLSDLRHLCDATGISFAAMDRIAHQHYLSELNS